MNNDKDVKAIAKKFFAAYDAHDVEGMLALCADGAQGRYLPYGRNSVVPIRGGLERIWRAFPQAVPDFRVEVVEMTRPKETPSSSRPCSSGPMPADVPGIAKKAQVGPHTPTLISCVSTRPAKSRAWIAYWDNTAINAIKASAL